MMSGRVQIAEILEGEGEKSFINAERDRTGNRFKEILIIRKKLNHISAL
jgi:hypothetical protein